MELADSMGPVEGAGQCPEPTPGILDPVGLGGGLACRDSSGGLWSPLLEGPLEEVSLLELTCITSWNVWGIDIFLSWSVWGCSTSGGGGASGGKHCALCTYVPA